MSITPLRSSQSSHENLNREVAVTIKSVQGISAILQNSRLSTDKKLKVVKELTDSSHKILKTIVEETTLVEKKKIVLEKRSTVSLTLHNETLLAIESDTEALKKAAAETKELIKQTQLTSVQAKFPGAQVSLEDDTAVVIW